MEIDTRKEKLKKEINRKIWGIQSIAVVFSMYIYIFMITTALVS